MKKPYRYNNGSAYCGCGLVMGQLRTLSNGHKEYTHFTFIGEYCTCGLEKLIVRPGAHGGLIISTRFSNDPEPATATQATPA